MLDKLKFRTKIIILVISALIGMAIQTGLSAMATKRDLIAGRQAVIRSIIESAHNTAQFYQAQEAAGVLTRAQAQRAALDVFLAAHFGGKDGKTDYLYVYQMDGVNLAHIKKEWIGQNIRDRVQPIINAVSNAPDGVLINLPFPRPGSDTPVDKLHYVRQFQPWGWFIGTGVYIDDIQEDFRNRLIFDLSLAAFLIGLTALLGLLISRGVLRQVGGEPADAITLMSRAAEGDLTVHIGNAPKGSMLASMDDMVSAMRNMLSEITRGSIRLSEEAENIRTAAHRVSGASQQQADATSSMAAAIEEMTVSINHISDRANDTERDSAHSTELAEAGVGKVQKANAVINKISTTVADASTRIRKLEEGANQISSIANVIKDIAGQTNLLALNAAIEAARAGEAGRGFAVVADEVRKLAERTSAATVEIEQMISGIQSDTEIAANVMDAALPQVAEGAEEAEGAAESLRQIKEGAQITLSHIREVADATKEQSMASNSIAQRVEEIASMVEATSATMQTTAEAAESLKRISNELHQLVSRFRC